MWSWSNFTGWIPFLAKFLERCQISLAQIAAHRRRASPLPPPTMDALSLFLEDPWGTFMAYWQAVPSHVRLLISFLLTRTVSGMIKRAVSPKGANAGPLKKGLVSEVGDLTEFNEKLASTKSGGKIMVVDFTATWCGPCKRVAPAFAAMSLKYGDVNFVKVDVDKAKDVSKHYGVKCMPTFAFFKDGEKVETMEGADAAKIEQILKTLGAVEKQVADPDEAPATDVNGKKE